MQKVEYACSCGKKDIVEAKAIDITPRICKCGELMSMGLVMKVQEEGLIKKVVKSVAEKSAVKKRVKKSKK